MGDVTPPDPPDQPLPDWMTWSLVTDADGNEEYTIVTLPLTYYGPSIPLGTDGAWTYGGLTSPADEPTEQVPDSSPTEDQPTILTPAPEPEPTTILITIPTTTTVYITETLPPVTVTITASPQPSTLPLTTLGTGNSSSPVSSVLSISGNASTSSSAILTTSGSAPPPSGTATGGLPNLLTTTFSSGGAVTQQPESTATPSSASASETAPAQESALPSVASTARTYLGLAPDAFLGVILAIVLSLILLLCCIVCWIRHRRRRRRRQQEEALPPTREQTSRLLAGDRDPTREDLAYPYANQGREYRRSQIAIMRARGELDDGWEDHLHSPSMRSASVRLPDEEVGTTYGFRERAIAAAGVYGYTPVPRHSPSNSTGLGSLGDSTQVPTITPANATIGARAHASPTPRKDTQSTDVTNGSSAVHLYAAGGRSRMDSNEAADEFFYNNNVSEGEVPSPVASSADLHFLQRFSTQGAGGAAAATARAVRRNTQSAGSGSSTSNNVPSSEVPHTRNLEEVPRATIAYPESPVSEDQEGSRLMSEGERREPPSTTMADTAPGDHSRSSKESGFSRWMHGGDRTTMGSQQAPILQRVLQRVMGNRLSTQPTFSIVPTSTSQGQPQHSDQSFTEREPSRASRDFDFGDGLLFPRPPMHLGYSSDANTAKDDIRRWGGILPSRLSSGQQSRTQVASSNLSGSAHGSRLDVTSLPHMEQGDGSNNRSLGAPIMANRDIIPQMKERAGTPTSTSLLGLGLRPPPPSAFPPERRTSSLVSSGRSTVYYDARSNLSTPMDTLSTTRDRAPSPLNRYDSPPPQPITALRNAQSEQSLQSAASAPFLPPGLFHTPDEYPNFEPVDALDTPPPMPTRDIRQTRSLNTIFSGGTTETYDTANPPLSIERAFLQDDHTRVPPPGLDSTPLISRPVPSDVIPSEAADIDLSVGSIRGTDHSWQRDHNVADVDEDVLEDEPPMAVNQWRVLSAYPEDDNGSQHGSVQAGNTRNNSSDQSSWRLTLGQPVAMRPLGEDSLSRSQDWPTGIDYGSQGSRGSSNRTNASHSRDIHSLRASEGAIGGSSGSKDSRRTGASQRSISEYGHIRYPGKSSEGIGDEALLSAFGPGPSRQARGTRGTMGSTGEASGDVAFVSSGKRPLWLNDRERDSPEPARPRTPPSAPAGSENTPGIRLVGAGNEAGTSGQGPSSAPVLPSRGWPAQGVPLDVTAADGRRPSQSHSFVHRESPLRPHVGPHSNSPGPSLSHSHSPSGGGRELSRPGTSTSHSHSHTHGTHGAETTMGTMTEATTEDDHEHEPMPDMPLSDVEHILRSVSPVVGESKVIEVEHGRGRIVEGDGGGVAPPSPGGWQQV